MKKLIIALILALCLLPAAGCGGAGEEPAPKPDEEAVGSDWRTWGIIDGYGTLTLGGETIEICACVYDNRAELYYDKASQELYRTVEYPEKLTEQEYKLAKISFEDFNGDGDTDIRVTVEDDGGVLRWMTWVYDIGEFVYMDALAYPPVPVDNGEAEDDGLESNMLADIPTVEDMTATWTLADNLDDTLVIFADENSLYGGEFTHTAPDGAVTRGKIILESFENPDGGVEYWYNFYTEDGEFWDGLAVSEEPIGGDLYMGQGGEPHFVRANG